MSGSKALEGAEGRGERAGGQDGQLLVGSSTEVFDIVPLGNHPALRDVTLDYRFCAVVARGLG